MFCRFLKQHNLSVTLVCLLSIHVYFTVQLHWSEWFNVTHSYIPSLLHRDSAVVDTLNFSGTKSPPSFCSWRCQARLAGQNLSCPCGRFLLVASLQSLCIETENMQTHTKATKVKTAQESNNREAGNKQKQPNDAQKMFHNCCLFTFFVHRFFFPTCSVLHIHWRQIFIHSMSPQLLFKLSCRDLNKLEQKTEFSWCNK